MAKRLLGILAVTALLAAGCGTAPGGSRIGTRIVSNNSASFHADATRAMSFGELDVEAIIRVAGKYIPRRSKGAPPDRPTTPQPIRPKPQASDEVDITTGQTWGYLDKIEDVVAFYPELEDQGTFLAATPKSRVEAIHAGFRAELEGLDVAASAEKERAWRKAGPEVRLRLAVGKLADVTILEPAAE